MRRITGWIIDLIYPRRCAMCDALLTKDETYICTGCKPKVQAVKDPYCMKCGKPLLRSEEEYCKDCLCHPHAFDRGRSVLVYEGPVKRSVYRFKYSGRKEYAEAYAYLAERHLGDFIRQIQPDALLPVPLHRSRYRKRGYNQAELFARALGRRMGIRVVANLVRRTKNTLPQKELDPQERQNNLKKAFKLSGNDVKLNTIIIIDDIYTTGSTIDAFSVQLKRAGVQRIYFLTISGGRS